LFKGGWDSHDLVSAATKIITKEILGYKNTAMKKGPWGSTTTLPSLSGVGTCGQDAAKLAQVDTLESDGLGYNCYWTDKDNVKHYHDFLPEMWPAGFEASIAKEVYTTRKVINMGPLGYFGVNGLYVTGAEVPSRYLDALEFWKSYLVPKNIQVLPGRAETEAVNQKGKTASGAYTCDSPKYTWCNNSRYTPPQCSGSNGDQLCRDVIMYDPGWASTQFEQFFHNMKLNLTTIYPSRAQWRSYLAEKSVQNEPALFYNYKPTTRAAALNMTRVTLPTHVDGEYKANASPDRYNPNGIIKSGSIKTVDCELCPMLRRLSMGRPFVAS
jgi:hypothetical protein